LTISSNPRTNQHPQKNRSIESIARTIHGVPKDADTHPTVLKKYRAHSVLSEAPPDRTLNKNNTVEEDVTNPNPNLDRNATVIGTNTPQDTVACRDTRSADTSTVTDIEIPRRRIRKPALHQKIVLTEDADIIDHHKSSERLATIIENNMTVRRIVGIATKQPLMPISIRQS
jgi:hypothetical protein